MGTPKFTSNWFIQKPFLHIYNEQQREELQSIVECFTEVVEYVRNPRPLLLLIVTIRKAGNCFSTELIQSFSKLLMVFMPTMHTTTDLFSVNSFFKRMKILKQKMTYVYSAFSRQKNIFSYHRIQVRYYLRTK